MTESPGAVKSADRVLELFELLAGWTRGMTHSDIAIALGIPKSSLSQLLKNMQGRGYVEYLPQFRTYCLGERFAYIARQTLQTRDLVTLVQHRLEEITKATGESSALNVLQGDNAQVVATVNGPHRLVTHMRLGDLAPLYATSSGKAILAFLPEAFLDNYLKRTKLRKITNNTLSSASQVRQQLLEVRKEHLAEVYEEYTPGIVGFAVPVLNERAGVLGAVNIAMPAARYNPKIRSSIVRTLKREVAVLADQLSRSTAELPR